MKKFLLLMLLAPAALSAAADSGADLAAPQRLAGSTGKSVEYHGTSAGRTD